MNMNPGQFPTYKPLSPVLRTQTTSGDKNIYDMGVPLGFNLLNDFGGFKYMFLGNFAALRPEIILWRLRMLDEIINSRRATFARRITVGLATPEQIDVMEELLSNLEIWVVTTSDNDKKAISSELKKSPIQYKAELFSLKDIDSELKKIT